MPYHKEQKRKLINPGPKIFYEIAKTWWWSDANAQQKGLTFQIFMQYWQVVMHNIVQQNFKTTGLMTFAVFMSFYVKEYGNDEDLATEDETEYTKMLCESDEEQETCEDILYTFNII